MEQKSLFDAIETEIYSENLGDEIVKMVETTNGIQISHFIRDDKTNDATLTRGFYAIPNEFRYIWYDNNIEIVKAFKQGWRTRQQISAITGVVL